MKSFYKTLLVALFLPLASFAQSNYKSGYVVTLKGDTLKGVIDYREWNSNPDYIDFKNSIADSKAKRFTPEDIGYFEVSGLENYIRYSGHISMDATDKDHLSNSRDTSYREAAVFFKVLQKGNNLSLYSYTDELKTRFYVAEAPDFAIKELVYRLYYNNGNDVSGQKGNTVTENAYMKQLFALANKYNVLNDNFQWDIEHAGYNSDDMLKIVSRINHFSKADYKKIIASKGSIFNLFVSAGVNIDNISSPAGTGYSMGGGKSGTAIGPAVSFGANFFANPNTQQLQFRVEIGATKGQFTSLYKLKVDPYVPFKVSFNETAFSIMPQVLYNFYNTENFKIYGDIGAAFNIYTFSNSYLGSQSQPNTAPNITENEPFRFSNSDDTFLFKIGVQINKRVGIYAQYLVSSIISTSAYFQMTQTGEQVGINYFFK